MIRLPTGLRHSVAARALVIAALLVTGLPLHGAEPSLRSILPGDIQWNQRRASPDVFIAVIYGEAANAEPYAFRVRAQAGHSLAPHTHPDERTVTVLSGTYWTAVGETFDESKFRAC